jgi:hypothetical protein
MCLWVIYKKKYEMFNFCTSLKSLKKGVGSGFGSGPKCMVPNTDVSTFIEMKGLAAQYYFPLFFYFRRIFGFNADLCFNNSLFQVV